MGASLVVFPENFPIFSADALEKVSIREKMGDGPIQRFLMQQARSHRIWIIAGTIPVEANDPQKIRAASLVYNDAGVCVARYDKIHLFDAMLSSTEIYRESDTVEAGPLDESNIQVVDTPVGKIGLAICYDIRFPEFIRLLIERGAEIIVTPSAFTVPTGKAHWDLLARGLVAQNLCYFVGACQGGRHENNRETYGHSLIIDPWARVIAEITGKIQGEGVIVADIDLKKIAEARAKLPIHEHRRFETVVKEQDALQPQVHAFDLENGNLMNHYNSFQSLSNAVWIFSALMALSELGALPLLKKGSTLEALLIETNISVQILAAALNLLTKAGLVSKNDFLFKASGDLKNILEKGSYPQILSQMQNTFGQARELIAASHKHELKLGWNHVDENILQAQGLFSEIVVTDFVPVSSALQILLQKPQATFLDVGAGVGRISLKMCEFYPHLHAVALEPADYPFYLAQNNISASPYINRIELHKGVNKSAVRSSSLL